MTFRWFGIAAALASVMLACAGAQADVFKYQFNMNGGSENPPNSSPATGVGTAIYDDVALTLTVTAKFKKFVDDITQTHFHAVTTTSGLPDNSPPGETPTQAAAVVGNVGVAVGRPSLPGFPTGLGVRSGTYAQVINLNDPLVYNTTFLSNNGGTAAVARATFVNSLATGRTYWNIHSEFRPGGEIRGFPVPTPEPATIGMTLVGIAGTAVLARRRLRA